MLNRRCVMALIRGLKCLLPCPKCYVPNKNLIDFTRYDRPHTAAETTSVLNKLPTLRNAEAREDLLKNHGLRNVVVSLSASPHFPGSPLSIERDLRSQ